MNLRAMVYATLTVAAFVGALVLFAHVPEAAVVVGVGLVLGVVWTIFYKLFSGEM